MARRSVTTAAIRESEQEMMLEAVRALLRELSREDDIRSSSCNQSYQEFLLVLDELRLMTPIDAFEGALSDRRDDAWQGGLDHARCNDW